MIKNFSYKIKKIKSSHATNDCRITESQQVKNILIFFVILYSQTSCKDKKDEQKKKLIKSPTQNFS